MREITFNTCPYPTLYPYYRQENGEVVMVDVLRVDTPMVVAFDHGAREIVSVVTTEEVESFLDKDYVVAAEHNAMRYPWADLGNDLSEFTARRIGGHSIVSTITNGTQAIHAAREAGTVEIIAGIFSDLTAVVCHCQTSGRAVMVFTSGWQGSFCIEDILYDTALLDKLEELDITYRLTDSGRVALGLYCQHRAHLYDYLCNYDHNRRLIRRSYPESLRLRLEQDCSIRTSTLSEAGQLYV